MKKDGNRYSRLLEEIFTRNHKSGMDKVPFQREELEEAAKRLRVKLPKNIGDVIYSFRYRVALPESIRKSAPEGLEWVIRSVGKAKYEFSLASTARINANPLLAEIKIPDATPGIISQYSLRDEQGLLAKLRYNRLLDIFSGVVCYSLQSHLRTTVPDMGQVETDKQGAQYIFPVQAKGGNDQIGIVQIEQDFALCASKFPQLICRPIAAQFMENDLIALFSFSADGQEVAILDEKHYRLVDSGQMTEEDISRYRHEAIRTS
ncbi:MAG: endonuclease [Gammaproteobacteria bacterium]|nr:endonuclease [Gammaproteobacteria bacterium]